jgi:S1-C subfamily serine protease
VAEFVTLTGPSVITEFAWHLVAWRGDHYDPFGSAILIRQNILLTAKHVIDDYWEKLQGGPIGSGGHGEFACMALQGLQDGRFVQHSVGKVFNVPSTDIALLLVDGPSLNTAGQPLPGVAMTMLPPPVGSGVRAFGYHDCSAKVDGDTVTIGSQGSTSTGTVIELHHERRDGQLCWPCFRVDARFDGGMSGGPVFNEKGELCGLVCKSMPPYPPDEEHVSYVTMLWPMLATMLDVPRIGSPLGRYAAIELARSGAIVARQWERVSLTYAGDGEVTSVNFQYG